MQKARDFSMPKDNIERAIERASASTDGAAFETVVYEGYGPGGAAFVVEALTDNRNRTAANVRSYFNKVARLARADRLGGVPVRPPRRARDRG